MIFPALVDVLDVDVVVLRDVRAVLLVPTRTDSPLGVEGFGFGLPALKVQRELVRCRAHHFLEGSRPA